VQISIDNTWDGQSAHASEIARLTLSAEPGVLRIDVDAPFHADPAPAHPVGPTWGLWDYEVVELFLLGPDGRYTEIELGPHGHHLVLQLHGVRSVTARELPLDYAVRVQGGRWTATARIERALLPPGPRRLNAYAIHGSGAARRYLAHAPAPGPAPDFHRLDSFRPVVLPR